ncbi:nitrate reductase [NADH]-like [Humulus lupulus]|uniref:nitrate reductase [NADH]-like n=1 Tax=Humulus lupulus TaxID=3486 RepID=UPI002B410902|nr:nitrate reductase [NADH]-like [Humulus lupulus]
MAASVENREFTHLKSGRNNVFVNHPSDSPPLRGYNLHSNFPTKQVVMEDSSSDEDEEESEAQYELRDLIRKSKNDLEPSINDPRDEGTADSWIIRNPSMVRLTGKHPFNSEPPLTRLMHYGFITPVPLHYVRNHGAVPKANWAEWSVEVTGLVKRPTRFTMDQLVNEFPSREFAATLVCAGNRRKEQNMVKKTIGFNWGAGGISNSVWRGVPLRALLKRCGIMTRKNKALNVCFEGAEDLPGGGGKYGTSIKKEFAMDPSRDIILAYMQNGELLAPDHGFPVRMIIPGFIGGRMVKWLRRIIVTTPECDSHYHFKDNRVLPSHVDAELANTESWWYKPEHIINELNINSVITTPCHGEILPINSWTTQRPYTLKGYAYSGGGKKVTRVEITMDGEETWQVCKLDHPEKPNKYGKYWCWCFWSFEVAEVLNLLVAKEIAVRAWDETHNTQPEKLIWNVMGMMNNCWFRVKASVCKPQKGEIGIVFEHPTQPGNQSGGWMAKERHLVEFTETNTTLKKSVSTPFMNTASKTYSLSEVKKHNSEQSCWIIVHDHIYDCTRFVKDHPGGADSILINAGTDCTEEFEAIHSDKARKMLEGYRIGELITSGNDSGGSSNALSHLETIKEAPTMMTRAVALVPRVKIPCKLVEKTSISHDVRVFKFALPSEDQVLGLPVGKHIFLCAAIDEKLCMRAYTPTSSVDEVGFFELLVKVYFKNVHPKFPNGGMMSQYLESLSLGSFLDVKGPLGHIEYLGRGQFSVHGQPKFAKKLAMLAGGTGITPIYQVVQAILKDPEDDTEMFVVYANRTEDDILLKEELDGWARKCDRFKVWYVVESAKEGWEYSTGFITEGILRKHIPEGSNDTLALTCGPPPMIQFAVQPNLEKMNYDKDSLLIF